MSHNLTSVSGAETQLSRHVPRKGRACWLTGGLTATICKHQKDHYSDSKNKVGALLWRALVLFFLQEGFEPGHCESVSWKTTSLRF